MGNKAVRAVDRPGNLLVTIIIPCLNEEKYLERCIESLLENDYERGLFEILIIDGMSTDKSRDIIDKYIQAYPCIKLVDNPLKIKPIALNVGIEMSDADVIMRIDVHALYETGYIRKLVDGLINYKADNIGGVRETYIGGNLRSKAIGHIISHSFGAGDAYYRTGSQNVKEVDTVYCGCYRREVFQDIGLFNEKLIRAQDREFNMRLKNAGGSIILDPSIKCIYYPRNRIAEYIIWNSQGAFWLYCASLYTSTKLLHLRNIIPPFFLLYSLLIPVAVFIFPWPLKIVTLLPMLAYLILDAFFSIRIAREEHSPMLAPLAFLLFAATHYSYAVGAILGLAKVVYRRMSGSSTKENQKNAM